ncbi:unnamed protein product [Amoebophrya sp. A120]|nr:unnamed protein product [Amoebophrya sp. A120]|eukprot:GSA120T00009475001.1
MVKSALAAVPASPPEGLTPKDEQNGEQELALLEAPASELALEQVTAAVVKHDDEWKDGATKLLEDHLDNYKNDNERAEYEKVFLHQLRVPHTIEETLRTVPLWADLLVNYLPAAIAISGVNHFDPGHSEKRRIAEGRRETKQQAQQGVDAKNRLRGKLGKGQNEQDVATRNAGPGAQYALAMIEATRNHVKRLLTVEEQDAAGARHTLGYFNLDSPAGSDRIEEEMDIIFDRIIYFYYTPMTEGLVLKFVTEESKQFQFGNNNWIDVKGKLDFDSNGKPKDKQTLMYGAEFLQQFGRRQEMIGDEKTGERRQQIINSCRRKYSGAGGPKSRVDLVQDLYSSVEAGLVAMWNLQQQFPSYGDPTMIHENALKIVKNDPDSGHLMQFEKKLWPKINTLFKHVNMLLYIGKTEEELLAVIKEVKEDRRNELNRLEGEAERKRRSGRNRRAQVDPFQKKQLSQEIREDINDELLTSSSFVEITSPSVTLHKIDSLSATQGNQLSGTAITAQQDERSPVPPVVSAIQSVEASSVHPQPSTITPGVIDAVDVVLGKEEPALPLSGSVAKHAESTRAESSSPVPVSSSAVRTRTEIDGTGHITGAAASAAGASVPAQALGETDLPSGAAATGQVLPSSRSSTRIAARMEKERAQHTTGTDAAVLQRRRTTSMSKSFNPDKRTTDTIHPDLPPRQETAPPSVPLYQHQGFLGCINFLQNTFSSMVFFASGLLFHQKEQNQSVNELFAKIEQHKSFAVFAFCGIIVLAVIIFSTLCSVICRNQDGKNFFCGNRGAKRWLAACGPWSLCGSSSEEKRRDRRGEKCTGGRGDGEAGDANSSAGRASECENSDWTSDDSAEDEAITSTDELEVEEKRRRIQKNANPRRMEIKNPDENVESINRSSVSPCGRRFAGGLRQPLNSGGSCRGRKRQGEERKQVGEEKISNVSPDYGSCSTTKKKDEDPGPRIYDHHPILEYKESIMTDPELGIWYRRTSLFGEEIEEIVLDTGDKNVEDHTEAGGEGEAEHDRNATTSEQGRHMLVVDEEANNGKMDMVLDKAVPATSTSSNSSSFVTLSKHQSIVLQKFVAGSATASKLSQLVFKRRQCSTTASPFSQHARNGNGLKMLKTLTDGSSISPIANKKRILIDPESLERFVVENDGEIPGGKFKLLGKVLTGSDIGSDFSGNTDHVAATQNVACSDIAGDAGGLCVATFAGDKNELKDDMIEDATKCGSGRGDEDGAAQVTVVVLSEEEDLSAVEEAQQESSAAGSRSCDQDDCNSAAVELDTTIPSSSTSSSSTGDDENGFNPADLPMQFVHPAPVRVPDSCCSVFIPSSATIDDGSLPNVDSPV